MLHSSLRTKTCTWSVRLALLLLLSIVAGQVHLNLVSLRQEEALLSIQDRVLRVRGGDVDIRDVPKAFQILDGRLFSDPHYEREVHWYPFAGPLIVAAVSIFTGLEVPSAYFRYELLMIAVWVVAIGRFGFRVTGRWQVISSCP